MASIVVVGGGVTGLVCAWRLRRAGHDVDVLERAEAPGGPRAAVHRGGFVLEPLPPWLASGERNLAAIARALGVAERLRPLGRIDAALWSGGSVQRLDLARPLARANGAGLALGERARLLRLLLAARREGRSAGTPDPDRAAARDDGSLAAGLRRALGAGPAVERVEALLEAALASDASDVSRAQGWDALAALSRCGARRRLEGGYGELALALSRSVPPRLGCTVASIETETGGARVRYRARDRARSVLSDAVVVAAPFSEVAALCPKLAPEERGFFEGCRRVDTVTVHLLYDRASRGLPGLIAFPHGEARLLAGVAVAHHEPGLAPAGAGLLRATLVRAAAERATALSDASVAERVVAALGATPVGRRAPDEVVVERGTREAWRIAPGGLRRLARFHARLERSPRLVFASGAPGLDLEAAIGAGMRAATEVIGSL
jgi:oxygen-dependent protoporphyrinogen oxidase